MNTKSRGIQMHRRNWLAQTAATIGVVSCGWFSPLARALAQGPRRRHCILLWMAGGPSQLDTFDLKPGHENGGEFKEIATAVPGLRFSEHLPLLAAQADQLAIVRGLSTKEGDHNRGSYLMRTGQRPGSPVKYPTIGSSLSKTLGDPDAPLPNYVAINPSQILGSDAMSPGFLGPKYAAATVAGINAAPASDNAQPGYAEMRVDDLMLPTGISTEHAARRQRLWDAFQQDFLTSRPVASAVAQDTVYRRAVRTMSSQESEAFDLSTEPDVVREAYGRGRFGQGCLVARRLVERGVPFVEVTLDGDGLGWDTHQDNFNRVKQLSTELDQAWSTLMTELRQLDMLKDTTILWMGEFGRTPKINEQTGRDHFPNAWTCVFAGGGIKGGQAYGRTSPDGMEVADGRVEVGDVLATLCQALGVDPAIENVNELGRPIKIAEGTPIAQILT